MTGHSLASSTQIIISTQKRQYPSC